ncbi:MAG: hypothetical protein V1494_01165 [Candidatus Diapherotrites archaeon]
MDYCKNCETRLCCKNIALPVELSIFDIYRIAKDKEIKLSDLFSTQCALIPVKSIHPYFAIWFSFGIHCSFLTDTGCACHKVKPVTCMQFPASIIFQRTIDDYSMYPCEKFVLPEQDSLNDLSQFHRKEMRKHYALVFNNRIPILPVKNLPKKELAEILANDSKISALNISQTKRNELALEFMIPLANNLMMKSDLTYEFHFEDGRSEEITVNLWQHSLERIKEIEQNRGFTQQAEFYSRKYSKIRKKYMI